MMDVTKIVKITEKIRTKVPRGSRIFPDLTPLPPEERARQKAIEQAFAQRCEQVFQRVYADLVTHHYNWYIYIEPNSGDYFIDQEREVARKKAKEKHPIAVIMAMRLNETGTVGRI